MSTNNLKQQQLRIEPKPIDIHTDMAGGESGFITSVIVEDGRTCIEHTYTRNEGGSYSTDHIYLTPASTLLLAHELAAAAATILRQVANRVIDK
jgi:hypothetical protein